MRNLVLVVVTLGIWLAAPGCMFMHDAGCQDDSDCNSGRVCDGGDCVARPGQGSGASNLAEGEGEGTGALEQTAPGGSVPGGGSTPGGGGNPRDPCAD